MNTQLYRGLAHSLGNAATLPEVLSAARLDWKVCEMPILMQGKHENRLFPGRKALVRCDNGHPIEVVSDKFHVHQNADLVGSMVDAANAGGISLTSGGAMDGGAKIFVHGSIDKQFDASGSRALGDIVRLDFSLRGGHCPGTPSVLSAMAMRLSCLNGATIGDSSMNVRITHRTRWSNSDAGRVRDFVAHASRAFESYEDKARRLLGHKMSRAESEIFVLELLEPELLRLAVAQPSAPGGRDIRTGAQVLNQIMSRDSSISVVRRLIEGEEVNGQRAGRAVCQIVGLLGDNPGSEIPGVDGTVWNAYNAATYYVDHVRGRASNPDSAVESALSGEGARIKARALNLAVEYTERGVN
ncbi:MAG: DUF932 domain-containing protein [Methylocella sp.]